MNSLLLFVCWTLALPVVSESMLVAGHHKVIGVSSYQGSGYAAYSSRFSQAAKYPELLHELSAGYGIFHGILNFV